MTTILNLLNSTDPRDDIHRGVQALAEGKLVGLPLETGFAATAVAVNSQSVAGLARLDFDAPPAFLLVSSIDAARDYLPRLSEFQERIAVRLWPGPVVLRVPGSSRAGLAASLPYEVRTAVSDGDDLRIMVTDAPVAIDVLRLLPAPLVARLEATSVDASRRGPTLSTLVDLLLDAGPPERWGTPTVVRLLPDRTVVESEGAVAAADVAGAACKTFLFVCTGNTCRSPMAAALFRKLLAGRLQCPEEELEHHGFRVLSAGLSASRGMPASPEAVELIERQGGRLAGHSSQPLTASLLAQADRIYTMTVAHRMAILQQYPELVHRVQTLAPDGTDVADPIGCGPDEYRQCAAQILKYLQTIVASIPGTE
jgi:protein-tyrosine-phosphatase